MIESVSNNLILKTNGLRYQVITSLPNISIAYKDYDKI